jgi:riboflavin kinase/FMN adenylyltransferase
MELHELHLPKLGVYAVLVDILDGPYKGRFKGAASIGVRPMFGKNTPNLETYIFDFSGDIYGAQVSIALVEYLRPELSFDTVDILVKQMASDCEKAKEILCKT